MPAPQKTRAERVSEAVTLLKKLKEVDIGPSEPGYIFCKEKMDLWIQDGKSASYKVEFPHHGRKGELVLPARQGVSPSIHLKAPT
jgi:hypothetical protein